MSPTQPPEGQIPKVDTIQARLVYALGLLPEGTQAERIEALHYHCREMGVRGVHSTRLTLRRWLSRPESTPPEYWLDIAAGFLGVNPKWLRTGDGVMFAKSGRIIKAEEHMNRAKERVPEDPVANADVQAAREAARKPHKLQEERPVAHPKPRQGEAVEKPVEPAEPHVAIPTAGDVHAANVTTVKKFLAQTNSLEVVKAILKHEPSNPNYEGGRKTVLAAAEERKAEIKAEA